MRTIKVGSYSPITALATAYATAVTSTGAALTLVATAPTDGLGHLTTLTSPGANDLRGVTFTIVGTDADGKVQTEALAGANSSSTVTGVKYFRTVTSVTPSATMGGLTTDIGIGAVSIAPTVILERRSIAGATMAVDISGTIDFTVSECFDNAFSVVNPSSLTFFPLAALTAKTADTIAVGTVAASAIQFKVNSVTNTATYTMYVSQATQQTG